MFTITCNDVIGQTFFMNEALVEQVNSDGEVPQKRMVFRHREVLRGERKSSEGIKSSQERLH